MTRRMDAPIVDGRSLAFCMTHRKFNAHPAMTAIAAAIALSSAPLFAQSIEAPNLTAPAPAADTTAPVAADPLAPDVATETPAADTPAAADPLAAEATAKPAVRKATTAKSTAARPRPAATRMASAAPAVAATPAVAAPVAETTAEPPLPVEPEAVAVSAPVAEPPAPAETSSIDPMVPVAGIGALGILALVGTGLVVRRRRRRADEADDAARRQFIATGADSDADAGPVMAEPEPAMTVEPAAMIEPDPAPAAPVAAFAPARPPADCIEAAPGSHVEAACEGPTADNPSLSIKKRVKRAQFFDQREFLVAAGEAVPVEPDAGLPDAVEVPEAKPPAREPA